MTGEFTTQKITPNLWFDNQAEEAAAYYVSLFDQAASGSAAHYGQAAAEVSGQAEGSVLTVPFTLKGLQFVALNGGPHFTFNPSISFFVHCDNEAEVDALFEGLSAGGAVLMPLQAYPFSEKFAWVQDRYGLTWQLNLNPAGGGAIVPAMLFTGAQCGRAEEAIALYTNLFDDSAVDAMQYYGPDAAPEREGTVLHAVFRLAGQPFSAQDSNLEHGFAFNEAISFIVDCRDQAEVDYFWDTLAAGGEIQQCGWLKDKFGVSWQIIPRRLPELLGAADREKAERATQAMLQMKKIDVAALERAFAGV